MNEDVLKKDTPQVVQQQPDMLPELALPASYAKNMTPEVARKVADFKASVDIHDSNKVVAYGREEQATLGKFADSILQGVGTKEVGEAGELLTKVIMEIKNYQSDCDKENSGGIRGFFKKQKNKLQAMQIRYKSIADNIDSLASELSKKDLSLAEVSRNFDVMYQENLSMYEYLTMVIYAGEQILEEEKSKLAIMQKEATDSGDMMEIQKASDYSDDILRFERRLYDLRITRTLAIQRAPQIRNIQHSAEQVSESIKSTIVTSINIWKSTMADILAMNTIKSAIDAVNAAKDATNMLLIAHSQMNKEITVEAAKARERGVVDFETIEITNKNLIESLKAPYEITQQAIADRAEGTKKLKEKEEEIKTAIAQYTNLNSLPGPTQ